MNNQKSPKLVTLVKLLIYTCDMYNHRKDVKKGSKLGRRYEPRNTKNQTKRCEHENQGLSHTLNMDQGSKGDWNVENETRDIRKRARQLTSVKHQKTKNNQNT